MYHTYFDNKLGASILWINLWLHYLVNDKSCASVMSKFIVGCVMSFISLFQKIAKDSIHWSLGHRLWTFVTIVWSSVNWQACLHRELIKKSVCKSWTQYKCSRRSGSHTRDACVGICALAQVGLSLLADKEKPHNSCLFSDGQSGGVQMINSQMSLRLNRWLVIDFTLQLSMKELHGMFPLHSCHLNKNKPTTTLPYHDKRK